MLILLIAALLTVEGDLNAASLSGESSATTQPETNKDGSRDESENRCCHMGLHLQNSGALGSGRKLISRFHTPHEHTIAQLSSLHNHLIPGKYHPIINRSIAVLRI